MNLIRRGASLPDEEDLELLDLKRSPTPEEPIEVEATSMQHQVIWYDDKSHYRIVFKSQVACKPIETVNSVHRVWKLLRQSAHGEFSLGFYGSR